MSGEKGNRVKTSKAMAIPTGQTASLMKPRAFRFKDVEEYEDMKAYRDQSIAWVLATRGVLPYMVVESWDQIQWPMNQFRSHRLALMGAEVGAAYEFLARVTTDSKVAKKAMAEYDPRYIDAVLKARFLLTTEEDNVIPPMAVQHMLEAIYKCPDCGREVAQHCSGKRKQCKQCSEWRCEKGHKGYDGVSGLYWIKRKPAIPMAYGRPSKPGDFRPRSVAAAIKKGAVMEVNGIAMGCAIFRKDMFKKVKRPWFKTVPGGTQDLRFCRIAKEQAGARFAVHCGIEVGHLDVNTGELI